MIRLKKVRPLFNSIITTMDVYEEDQYIGSVIDTSRSKGTMKEYQKVIAVGDTVKSIKVGDVVLINPKRYAIMKHNEGSLKNGVVTDNPVIGYQFDTIMIDGKECLHLFDSDISYIIDDWEEEAPPVIIQPEKPRIIKPV